MLHESDQPRADPAAIHSLWVETVTAMLASILHDHGRHHDAAVLKTIQKALAEAEQPTNAA